MQAEGLCGVSDTPQHSLVSEAPGIQDENVKILEVNKNKPHPFISDPLNTD